MLVIDDVISAGTSMRESIGIIRAAGARAAGIAISLDRQERGQGRLAPTGGPLEEQPVAGEHLLRQLPGQSQPVDAARFTIRWTFR